MAAEKSIGSDHCGFEFGFLVAFDVNRAMRRMSSTSSSMPSPVMQFVKTNGLPGRIRSESTRMTSRSACT